MLIKGIRMTDLKDGISVSMQSHILIRDGATKEVIRKKSSNMTQKEKEQLLQKLSGDNNV
jgi:hypothetical protein